MRKIGYNEQNWEVPMRLRIGRAILDTDPCSSASQVISEDSDLYWPYLNMKGRAPLSNSARDYPVQTP